MLFARSSYFVRLPLPSVRFFFLPVHHLPKTMTLTQTLLSHSSTSSSYTRATQHPFLVSAGKLELSAESLQSWLTQDRLYALCGYASFLGLLISKCPAPAAGPTNATSKLHRKRLTVLAGAMANIDREVGFFEDVAKENGLNLDAAKEDSGLGLLNQTTRVSCELDSWGLQTSY